MPTINEVYKNYNEQYKRYQLESNKWYAEWRKSREAAKKVSNVDQSLLKSVCEERYPGFEIDYGGLEQDLIAAVRQEYGLTEHQATYLVGHASQEKHANYDGVFNYLREICELINTLPKD